MIRGNGQAKQRRSMDDLSDDELEFLVARGNAATAKKILKGANKGAEAAGNVGTALTGVSDFVGMIRGQGKSKRDFEGYFDDDVEIFARSEFDFEDFDY